MKFHVVMKFLFWATSCNIQQWEVTVGINQVYEVITYSSWLHFCILTGYEWNNNNNAKCTQASTQQCDDDPWMSLATSWLPDFVQLDHLLASLLMRSLTVTNFYISISPWPIFPSYWQSISHKGLSHEVQPLPEHSGMGQHASEGSSTQQRQQQHG